MKITEAQLKEIIRQAVARTLVKEAAVGDTAVITVLTDGDMASVSLNGKLVMLGNENDFYPGAHGIKKYGNFQGSEDLVNKIKAKLRKVGKRVVVKRPASHWDDDRGEFVSGPAAPEPAPPKAPPKTSLSPQTKTQLKALESQLTALDRSLESFLDNAAVSDLPENVIAEFEAFSESISWETYHGFKRALRAFTDFEEE